MSFSVRAEAQSSKVEWIVLFGKEFSQTKILNKVSKGMSCATGYIVGVLQYCHPFYLFFYYSLHKYLYIL